MNQRLSRARVISTCHDDASRRAYVATSGVLTAESHILADMALLAEKRAGRRL